MESKHSASGSHRHTVGDPFPSKPSGCEYSDEAWRKIGALFKLIDTNGCDAITKDGAKKFFTGAFAGLSVDAMFNEVDADSSEVITGKEFAHFWVQVLKSGYKEAEILEEVEEMMTGSAWVDWNDGCNTDNVKVKKFPGRPFLNPLSRACWKKCEDLFRKIDHDGKLVITKDKASKHFKGGLTKIACEAMFNEVDTQQCGVINADDWMAFWAQVKRAGYKEKLIMEELEQLMEGSPWVDWKDGRNT